MTDDEMLEAYNTAVESAMHRANERDGFACNMSRESRVAGLRAVERAAAARALREFAQHLIESVMPEHGSHINMTQYREGLVDGVNRAVTAAGRRAAEIREGENNE